MRRIFFPATLLLLAACSGGSSSSQDSRPPADRSSTEGLKFADQTVAHDKAGPTLDKAVTDGPKKKLDGPIKKPDATVPTVKLSKITLLVNLGDSHAAGYYATSGNSYKALLVKNNDLLYPTHKGKDLSTLFPGLKVTDKSKSGAKTDEILKQAKSVSGNFTGNTLVLISAGGNDFNDSLATMLMPLPVAQKATANLKQIAAHFANKSKFPGTVTMVMLNIYDPTDGMGSIPNKGGLSGFCKTILKFGLMGGLVVTNLALFNGQLAAFAKANKVILADQHKRFLGHGFNHKNPLCKHYDAKDASLWFYKDCAHGNNRGHHEVRKLIWSSLGGK